VEPRKSPPTGAFSTLAGREVLGSSDLSLRKEEI
jgi:hypothetical protein